MKKYVLLVLLVFFAQSCSLTTTATVVPTTIPTATPVGYGVEFPFNLDPNTEWGENVTVTCSQSVMYELEPDTVKRLVAAGGKLDTSMGGDANLSYLWTGNVPLELFAEPAAGYGRWYDISGTSYCVSGLDERGWTAYVTVITKVMPP